MDFTVTLLMSEYVTHDVKRFIVSKPKNFVHEPGQGVELVIDAPRWRDKEGRPFTPTSLPADRVLEFTIKRYPEHHGVTEQLHTLEPGAELLMSKPFGTIRYKGPGVFIAAGAGITPFLGILRQAARQGELQNQRLLFANKTAADIICEKELRHYLGEKCFFTLSREDVKGYRHGRIDSDLLRETISDFDRYFYVCGPDEFVADMNRLLKDFGAQPDLLVFEG
jgi:ferredoxin-NADP reductase